MQLRSYSHLAHQGSSSPWLCFRDPVNGFLHLGALLLSIVGTAALLWASRGDALQLLTVAIYGLSMCGCFLASSLHHLVRGERALEMRLLRWDHAAIYPFIAGSYTPVCLHLMPRTSGLVMLAVVWAIALAGVIYKLRLAPEQESVDDPPPTFDTLIYIAMGWLIVVQIGEVIARAKGGTLALPVAGGLAYSVGGVVLTRRLLDFVPGRFGHHEIWHLFVIAGAACFYAFLWLNLA